MPDEPRKRRSNQPFHIDGSGWAIYSFWQRPRDERLDSFSSCSCEQIRPAFDTRHDIISWQAQSTPIIRVLIYFPSKDATLEQKAMAKSKLWILGLQLARQKTMRGRSSQKPTSIAGLWKRSARTVLLRGRSSTSRCSVLVTLLSPIFRSVLALSKKLTLPLLTKQRARALLTMRAARIRSCASAWTLMWWHYKCLGQKTRSNFKWKSAFRLQGNEKAARGCCPPGGVIKLSCWRSEVLLHAN